MRTRFLSKCTNQEVESYLNANDIIIVPVGVTELHGGLPMDSESALAEGIALKMAEACDGLVLHNLPYFYAGSTIRGRGTVQVNVEPSIQYLKEVTKSLIRQGFRRIIFTSFHGPAHLYISPVVRDIFEEYHVPVLYIDPLQALGMEKLFAEISSEDPFSELILGAYDLLGRLEDVPLTTPENDFWTNRKESTTAFANKINGMAYASGAIGMIFGDHMDHMPTVNITSESQRQKLADDSRENIDRMITLLDMPEVVKQMKQVDEFVEKQANQYQWTNNI